MAVDYGAKEREFLAGLQADTGRDLAQWMAAIDGAGLAHRNDIIDWLRRQGFMFSKASWLERIHHNGGRPLYGEGAADRLGNSPMGEIVSSLKTAAQRLSTAILDDAANAPAWSAASLGGANGHFAAQL